MAIIPNFTAFKTLFQNAEGMSEGSEYVANTYSLADLTRFIGNKPEHVRVQLVMSPIQTYITKKIVHVRWGLWVINSTVCLCTSGGIANWIHEDLQLAELFRFRLPLISQNANIGLANGWSPKRVRLSLWKTPYMLWWNSTILL